MSTVSFDPELNDTNFDFNETNPQCRCSSTKLHIGSQKPEDEAFGLHENNKTSCSACLCGYPKRCSCGGLIHAAICNDRCPGITVVYKCDRCAFNLEIDEE